MLKSPYSPQRFSFVGAGKLLATKDGLIQIVYVHTNTGGRLQMYACMLNLKSSIPRVLTGSSTAQVRSCLTVLYNPYSVSGILV